MYVCVCTRACTRVHAYEAKTWFTAGGNRQGEREKKLDLTVGSLAAVMRKKRFFSSLLGKTREKQVGWRIGWKPNDA